MKRSPQKGNKRSAVGADRHEASVRRRAAARRSLRKAQGEPLVFRRTRDELRAAAGALLKRHHLISLPATEQLAKLHVQMSDAVDHLYDICLASKKDPRLVSAMVSAAKVSVTALEKLGLPGEELEDEEADLAERTAMRLAEKTTDPEQPSEKPDELEAYE